MNYYTFVPDIINNIKNMKCALYECDKNAAVGYPCCSMTHGVMYKQNLEDLRDYQSGIPLENWFYGYGPGYQTLEALEFYAQHAN